MNQDHIVYRILDGLGKLIVCSILWVLCSLPVITLGASSTALYYAVVKAVRRDSASVFQAFFFAFRENFRQSTVVHILLLWLSALPAGVLISAYLGQTPWGTLQYAMAGAGILLALVGLLVYPVISRFYHRGGALLRFLLLLMGRHPLVGLGSLLIAAGCGLLVLSNGAALLFVPGILAYAQSFLLEPVFRKYSSEGDNFQLWYEEAAK